MKGTTEEGELPHQSSSTSSSKAKESESYTPSSFSIITDEPQPNQPYPAASYPPSDEETKKWGTHIMGAPAAPTVHPDNQKAALWTAADHQQIYHQPYVVYSPVDKPSNNPFEPVIHVFNNWSRKAETIARNIWHNRKLNPIN
jgi:hypothetical protein